MIIDEIKQANIEALKKHDNNLRSIYSVLMNKIMLANINARANETELTDVDVVKIIQKTIKELDEEAENYKKVGNTEEFEKIGLQRNALEKYLPTMLSKHVSIYFDIRSTFNAISIIDIGCFNSYQTIAKGISNSTILAVFD